MTTNKTRKLTQALQGYRTPMRRALDEAQQANPEVAQELLLVQLLARKLAQQLQGYMGGRPHHQFLLRVFGDFAIDGQRADLSTAEIKAPAALHAIRAQLAAS